MPLWVAFSLAISAVLLLLVILQPVAVEVEYWREGSDDRFLLVVRGPYGLVWQRLEMPLVEFLSTRRGPVFHFLQETQDKLGGGDQRLEAKLLLTDMRQIRRLWTQLRCSIAVHRPVADYLMRHVHLEALTWETKVGVADAAGGGVVTGLVWGIKGAVLTFLSRRFSTDGRVAVMVTPDWYSQCFHTFFHCILNIRLVHVINAQARILWWKLRQGKR